MNEQDLIEQIAQPIIDQILQLEEEMGDQFLNQCPQIRLLTDDISMDSSEHGEYSLEFLKKIEEYIQDQLEEWFRPTILH